MHTFHCSKYTIIKSLYVSQNITRVCDIARDRRSSAIFRMNVIFCDIERNKLLINVLLLAKETISSNKQE